MPFIDSLKVFLIESTLNGTWCACMYFDVFVCRK